MFPGNSEFVAYEQHKDLVRRAERKQLIKALEAQQANDRGAFRKMINLITPRMAKGGLKLQSNSITPPSQVTATLSQTQDA